MGEYDKLEEEICSFKKYVQLSMDLMVDSFKWKKLAEYCKDSENAEQYKEVSDTLYSLFLKEYDKIENVFKKE